MSDLPEPARTFHVETAGAGLSPETLCSHGGGSLLFRLFGTLDGKDEALAVHFSPCIAPALFGAVLAFVETNGGSDTADKFLRIMLEARDQVSADILAQRDERAAVLESACCEAGFRTGGTEHTCRSGSQPSAS
jgi:hypothetical protein